MISSLTQLTMDAPLYRILTPSKLHVRAADCFMIIKISAVYRNSTVD